MKSAIPTVSIASVKRVLERQQAPTISEKYWTYNDAGEEHFQSLLTTLIDMANDIHRKSLRGPADFFIVPDKKIIESLFTESQFFVPRRGFPEIDPVKEIVKKDFVDAKHIGTLLNRFGIYESRSLPVDKILVGRFGEGIKYTFALPGPTGMPQISSVSVDIATESDTLYYKGEVAYWGFVKIAGLPEEK